MTNKNQLLTIKKQSIMNNQVKITANDKGQVVIESKNPEYGFIRVEQTRSIFEDGFFKPVTLSALIVGRKADLEGAGFYAGQMMPGKIVIKESMTPRNTKNPESELKNAGETGVVCSVEGNPIYRRTEFTTSLTTEDEMIKHDNGAQIAAAVGEAEKKSESFDM